jgi:hypothetical protein
MKQKMTGIILGVFLGTSVTIHAGETCPTAAVGQNLDISMPSILYSPLIGSSMNLWANFSFYGSAPDGRMLWALNNYGVNPNNTGTSIQPLLTSCTSDESYACVWFSTTEKSTCREASDTCFENIVTALRSNNVSYTSSLQLSYSEDSPYVNYKAGCIGYRSDLGGTQEGAKTLLNLLGDSRFYIQDSGCRSAGFKYNVILW